MLKRYKMHDCNPVAAPMEIKVKFTKDLEPSPKKEKQDMENVPYRQAVGSLLYLSVCTRTCYQSLNQFSNNSGKIR